MKNIIVATVVAATVSVIASTTVVKAGAWEKFTGFFADTVPSKMFAVEASGFNLRGYAFQLEKENKTCLFVAGENKGGLTCWDSK